MGSIHMKQIPSKNSEVILEKMFEWVGVDMNSFNFSQENWYWTHTWSQAQQDAFIEWLAEYLFINNLFKKKLYRGVPENLYRATQIVANYGWKMRAED